MSESQIGGLLTDLWEDLREPAIFWQIGTLALCVLLAWGLARRLQWRAPEGSAEALKRGAAAARRLAFPLLATLLLLSGRAALARWHSTHLLSVAIPLFGALAGIRFAVYLVRIAFAQSRWMDSFERSIATLIWSALALHLTGLLPEIVRWLSEVELSAGRLSVSLWTLLSGAFWVALTVLIALWAGAALEARLMRAEHLHSSLRAVFARLAKALLLVTAVLVVLPLIGVDLTVLSVFGGALGVGLGLGLQKIASNYLSGFIILLDRSIRLGDLITADGQHGQVTRITTRYVVVRSLTGVEAIIPNDTLVTTTVLNHSYSDRRVRLAVRVQVAYGTDLKKAFALMQAAARAHPRVLKEPEPGAQVVELADSGINLELGFWIEDPEAGSQGVRSDLSVAMLEKFQASGIEIPYPRRDIRLLQGSSPAKPGE
ncbi:MAG TPA: mechanosensitive ion channel domain-containing protein [Burkholderiales bacterium]|nr:mechanosensitive ion channel domain-containing protein [Burkholderiales bacterium]